MSRRDYVDGVLRGDRRALARAITLAESTLPGDIALAADVLQELQPHTGRAVRIGVSGVPGAGKSTLLDELGTRLAARGQRVAVLAVDPSSTVSGGSILGDKTRMERLARDERAYVRPSPSGDAAGGVARRTREALLLCEAAGFDVVFVETVGVGQSETAVVAMVDLLLVLVLTGAGDDLQGIKRGLLELADLLAVTKADGDNAERARRTAGELRSALHILQSVRSEGPAPVLTCSARDGSGIDALWDALAGRHAADRSSGRSTARRREQDLAWFDATVDELIRARAHADPDFVARRARLRAEVAATHLAPAAAARRVFGD
ncbi:MAG: methylmalonyl Co-A mutase-associated GTPase MeaB [Planctomycetes bacterium]|nr:methylmalonyl Co-A mutase-associated GTPase MeaB [Planctomycetota bacterium]